MQQFKVINLTSVILLIAASIFSFFAWPIFLLGAQAKAMGYSEIFAFFKDWQDLLAGILAITAAFWATRPVWHQLKVTRIQTAAVTRDVLMKNTSEIRIRLTETDKILKTVTDDFLYRIYPYDYDADPIIDPHWCWSAEQIVDSAINEFSIHQARRIDDSYVERARAKLMGDMQELSSCIVTINTPIKMDFNDEYGFTEDEISKANDQSEQAKQYLVARIRAVCMSGNELKGALNDEISKTLIRVRQMDDIVINLSLIDR